MTTNQTRALRLARALSDGRLGAAAIGDDDWNLLLLAAGMNHAASTPAVVTRQVLESALAQTGYFWPGDGFPAMATCRDMLAPTASAAA